MRGLQLRPTGSPVRYHDGRLKGWQHFHYAVVDMDIGESDLQQCADFAIRLRAEYLYSRGEYERITFNFTSGHAAAYLDWRDGLRPVVSGSDVRWQRAGQADASYGNFRDYLDTVFLYAGTYSISRDLTPVEDPAAAEIGDIYVMGGFPGHAVVVMDVAEHSETGERLILLAQGFMPAQDLHILKNFEDPDLSPWYRADFARYLHTPQWSFERDHLRRWPPE
jgi:hypothetical protein